MPSRCPPEPARESGTATAEFAVALPGVVLVTAALLGGLAAGAAHLRGIDAAATAARSVARGDAPAVTAALVAASGAGRITGTTRAGGLVCVTVSAVVPVFGADVLPLASRSCALDDGGATVAPTR